MYLGAGALGIIVGLFLSALLGANETQDVFDEGIAEGKRIGESKIRELKNKLVLAKGGMK